MQSPQHLNATLAIPGRIGFESGAGGLTIARLATSASRATIHLQGAHIAEFALLDQPPLLFVSARSRFEPGTPIRGGVPICFPWFGQRSPDPVGGSPMHGFARTLPWTVEATSANADGASITLSLLDHEQTRRWWPHAFTARQQVELIPDRLRMTLSIQNTGRDSFTFEEALHTYFSVGDARNIEIEGLSGLLYLDKTDNLARKAQTGDVVINAETDRIYLGATGRCVIRDPGNGRKIISEKEHSCTTVVWNPWIAKARAMADFGDEEWSRMVCVETCNVGPDAITLDAGQSHQMTATLRTEPL